jgi:2,3-bisphosphoglycerate-dependent phosphoglycerate mutase
LELSDPRYPGNQAQFEHIPAILLPRAESMFQTWQRVRPVWEEAIAPAVRDGQTLLIVAHKNSLRVLIKEFTGLDGADVERLAIRTGRPLVYEFDSTLQPIRSYFLTDSR